MATKTLEFAYTVQLNDKIDIAFNIDSKDDIVLSDIKDIDGNTINFGSTSNNINISINSKNLALNSKGLATITTNVTSWHNGGTAANISRMTDGNTSSSGALDYAAHPNGADGKHSLPATMTLLLPTLAKIMSLSNVNVNLISSPIVNTPLLLAAPLSIRQALL
jgi:hypothetical protein